MKTTLIFLALLFFSILAQSQIVWNASFTTFTKADGTDPNIPSNQDQINTDVAITRGRNGGGLYNAVSQTSALQNSNPAGTEWAVGSAVDFADFTFTDFRSAVGRPRSAPGQSLVMHLIAADIYIDVTFNSWSQGNGNGGFSYTRATAPATAAINDSNSLIGMYPNPTTSVLKVGSKNPSDEYSVYDIAGRLLLNGKLDNNSTVDVSSLDTGLFIINVTGSSATFVKQ
ncbi:T9SS type A sorting domain-containing protein [Nonlabens ponticola]|uniref:T9SS type A sorting domain-containing protein n=1 Tax=Nonlabens ponticola TaxID=2496866 RepID=A0A3S9MVR1_9FLAO|nr:T9SS type A sorting domain-containing protein [Nonlabens ponticola]AZQ43301.1 T9SS type A sorting domain-containing protein [Nonlabens ponticola]